MNLSGFCAATRASGLFPSLTCGTSASTPSIADQVNAAQVNPQTAPIFGAVRNGLYRLLAAIGRNVGCPSLPYLGEGLGLAAASLFAAEEITLTVGTGIAIAVGVEDLAAHIGRAVGEAVQKEVCS